MRFPLFVANRYFLARKSHNIINLISAISLLSITIGTMALITVLSVFNGFESLVTSLFNAFNPDFEITAEQGKTFEVNAVSWDKVRQIPGIASVSMVLEEKALFKYKSRQIIVSLKGVESGYGKMSGLDTMLASGGFIVNDKDNPSAVCGYGIAYQTDLVLQDFRNPIEIYFPKSGKINMAFPADAFQVKYMEASGIFSVQQEFDQKYVFVPLNLMQEFLNTRDKVSSVEIRLSPGALHEKVKSTLNREITKGLTLKNKYQQEETLYKIMRSEKWAIFLILTFILIVATFNVIGSLTMLILEKKKDIAILFSLGASEKDIRRIFLLEGWLISFFGSLFGIILGFIICFLQERYGFLKLGGESGAFLVQAYPVKILLQDFFGVFLTVNLIGLIAAFFPVYRISQRYLEKRLLSS